MAYAKKLVKHVPARQLVDAQPLTGDLIHRLMSRIFSRRNDYGSASFDELVPELARFGIGTRGQFRQLMTRHRHALLLMDRARLAPGEFQIYVKECGESFVRDAMRRQFFFAYPALVRSAVELEFGEAAAVYES